MSSLDVTSPDPDDGPLIPDGPLIAGTFVGPWRIENVLGVGGTGTVYGVTHQAIGKRAALKILHRSLATGLAGERVSAEACIVNWVSHPSIVDIFDAGEHDERPYLVMERLDGVTLRAYAGGRRMSLEDAVPLLLQLGHALAAAHAAGVIHRDLKPDNIFVVDVRGYREPRVKLLDWGIAKVLGDTERRTMKGQLMGTPAYLAPEQARGATVSPATDVYALGVIVYEILVGALPFVASTNAEMLQHHHASPPRSPREVYPGLSASIERLILSMLAKDPSARPSLDIVMCELRAAVATAEPARAAPRRPALVLPGVLLTAVAAMGALLSGPAEPERGTAVATSTASSAVATSPRVARARPHAASPLQPLTSPSAARPSPLFAVAPPRSRIEPPSAADALLLSTQPASDASVQSRPEPPSAPGASPPSRTLMAASVRRRSEPRVTDRERSLSDAPSLSRAAHAAPAATTASAVVARYVSLGEALARSPRHVQIADLRSRYRLVRIYQALATAPGRVQAFEALSSIERELQKRSAITCTP